MIKILQVELQAFFITIHYVLMNGHRYGGRFRSSYQDNFSSLISEIQATENAGGQPLKFNYFEFIHAIINKIDRFKRTIWIVNLDMNAKILFCCSIFC